MSDPYIKWHRENSKNAKFTDADAKKVRPLCKACVYGEDRQTSTDRHRIHRPLPTIAGQCFAVDAFACGHISYRGYKYCDVMRDGASQMIYCNFTKSRGAEDIVQAFMKLWDLNPPWKVFDHRQPDHKNPRFIRMDSETSYKSAEIRTYFSDIGYKIEHTPPRDKHAGGIAERTVGLLTGKTNTAMMENTAPKSMWCWAMFKASQDLNFNYNEKIKTSPYHFVTGQHIDMKYLHSFFAECYMFIPLKDREGKLPHRRAQRCKFLAYSYTTILVPTYIVLVVNDNGTYGSTRISKDIIFDESIVFDKYIDNSPTDEEFAALPVIIENVHEEPHEKVKIIWFGDTDRHEQVHTSDPEPEPTGRHTSPPLEIYNAQDYQDAHPEDAEAIVEPFPLVLTDTSEYEPGVDEYGMPVYWSKITREQSTAPVLDIGVFNYHDFMARCLMTITSAAPRSFAKAIMQPAWHPAINKEIGNFIDNTCFQWIKDVGQRRMMMIWLFSFKADMTMKARLVVNGKMCKPGLDYNPDETYCGNVAATSIKVFFALSALYGLTLRGGDLVGAYLVTPGSKDFMLCMATPDGIIAPQGMVLQVLGNLYGLPSSGRNFSKAVDSIVLKLGYKNTPYDPKFFIKWIGGMPIMVIFHSDDFRWCGPPHMLAEWDTLVAAFEASRYKVKDCTKEPFVGINVTSDELGNYYLDQKKLIESAVKAAKVSGAKVQKLPYPLDGPSLSKADNAKTEAEANDMAKIPYRAIVGMLSYIMGHTKPDIAYALNVLSRYCNNPGRRHVEFLLCLVKYCEYSKDDRLKFHAHPGPYDAETMRPLTQARFQCDADLAGNLDNSHSTSAHIGYIGHSVVSFTSKTQGSLSTSTAESEIKAVNQCLKEEALALRGMLILMGFPQDATIIEEDNQACVYASEIPHMTRGMRHLDLAELLIKEKVDAKEIKLLKVASADNTSDLGTKRLALPLFNKLTSRIIDKTLRVNL